MNTATFKTPDGLKILTRWWDTAPAQPRAMVAVCALDLPGRGESEGERLFVEDFDDYVDEVGRLITIAKTRQPLLPIFLLGHSAGGVVSCLYALRHRTELAGLICESFAYELPAPNIALTVLKGISHIAPHVHVERRFLT